MLISLLCRIEKRVKKLYHVTFFSIDEFVVEFLRQSTFTSVMFFTLQDFVFYPKMVL